MPCRTPPRQEPPLRTSRGSRRNITVQLEDLTVGQSLPGKVKSIQSYGAFVDIGAFTDGLVHISELQNGYVQAVEDVVAIGQDVTVRVKEVDADKGRIALTMRDRESEAAAAAAAAPSAVASSVTADGGAADGDAPGAGIGAAPGGRLGNRGKVAGGRGGGRRTPAADDKRPAHDFKKGQMVKGTVKNLASFGAFIELAEGSMVTAGQEVNVRILRIERNKISLTMRERVDLKGINTSINDTDEALNPFELAFRRANLIQDKVEADKVVEASLAAPTAEPEAVMTAVDAEEDPLLAATEEAPAEEAATSSVLEATVDEVDNAEPAIGEKKAREEEAVAEPEVSAVAEVEDAKPVATEEVPAEEDAARPVESEDAAISQVEAALPEAAIASRAPPTIEPESAPELEAALSGSAEVQPAVEEPPPTPEEPAAAATELPSVEEEPPVPEPAVAAPAAVEIEEQPAPPAASEAEPLAVAPAVEEPAVDEVPALSPEPIVEASASPPAPAVAEELEVAANEAPLLAAAPAEDLPPPPPPAAAVDAALVEEAPLPPFVSEVPAAVSPSLLSPGQAEAGAAAEVAPVPEVVEKAEVQPAPEAEAAVMEASLAAAAAEEPPVAAAAAEELPTAATAEEPAAAVMAAAGGPSIMAAEGPPASEEASEAGSSPEEVLPAVEESAPEAAPPLEEPQLPAAVPKAEEPAAVPDAAATPAEATPLPIDTPASEDKVASAPAESEAPQSTEAAVVEETPEVEAAPKETEQPALEAVPPPPAAAAASSGVALNAASGLPVVAMAASASSGGASGGSGGGVSAAVVKALREETGAGMMDCKKALAEAKGDLEAARDVLRRKGLASADKKSSRAAAEGVVGSYIHDGRIGVLIEVNCETDFVARGDAFKELVEDLGMQVAACPAVMVVSTDEIEEGVKARERELELGKEDLKSKPEAVRAKIVDGRVAKRLDELALLEQPYIKDDKVKVKDLVKSAVARIGENIRVRRFVRFNLGEGLAKKSTDFAAEVAAAAAGGTPKAAEPSVTEPAAAEPAAAAPEAAPAPAPAVAVAPALVKELRESTGAGMMDCKKALAACGGDLDAAADYLRKKGLASAAKKAGRAASEGLVGSYIHDGRIGVLIEVNSETDFVARSDQFKELVENLAMQVAASPAVRVVSVDDIDPAARARERELEEQKEDLKSKPEGVRAKIVDGRVAKRYDELALLEQPYIRDDKLKVKDLVKATVAALGENIQVRRFERFNLGEGLERRSADFAAEIAAAAASREDPMLATMLDIAGADARDAYMVLLFSKRERERG
eukprot:SM000146S00985  [mRNA]  locus=s146:233825:240070:- [translate_table: standard]